MPTVCHAGGCSPGSSRSTIWLLARVRRQRDRVRVGDEVALDLPGRRHVHLHLVQVVLPVPGRLAGDRPDAAGLVEGHLGGLAGRVGVGVVEPVQRHRPCGRRPQPQRGRVAVPDDAEVDVGRGGGVAVVEHRADLQAGRRGAGTVAGRGDREPPAQRRVHVEIVGHPQDRVVGEVREALRQLVGQGVGDPLELDALARRRRRRARAPAHRRRPWRGCRWRRGRRRPRRSGRWSASGRAARRGCPAPAPPRSRSAARSPPRPRRSRPRARSSRGRAAGPRADPSPRHGG